MHVKKIAHGKVHCETFPLDVPLLSQNDQSYSALTVVPLIC